VTDYVVLFCGKGACMLIVHNNNAIFYVATIIEWHHLSGCLSILFGPIKKVVETSYLVEK